jgi:hypothetical protein
LQCRLRSRGAATEHADRKWAEAQEEQRLNAGWHLQRIQAHIAAKQLQEVQAKQTSVEHFDQGGAAAPPLALATSGRWWACALTGGEFSQFLLAEPTQPWPSAADDWRWRLTGRRCGWCAYAGAAGDAASGNAGQLQHAAFRQPFRAEQNLATQVQAPPPVSAARD